MLRTRRRPLFRQRRRRRSQRMLLLRRRLVLRMLQFRRLRCRLRPLLLGRHSSGRSRRRRRSRRSHWSRRRRRTRSSRRRCQRRSKRSRRTRRHRRSAGRRRMFPCVFVLRSHIVPYQVSGGLGGHRSGGVDASACRGQGGEKMRTMVFEGSHFVFEIKVAAALCMLNATPCSSSCLVRLLQPFWRCDDCGDAKQIRPLCVERLHLSLLRKGAWGPWHFRP